MRTYFSNIEDNPIPEAVLTLKQREYLRNANATWNIAVGATRSGKSFLGFRILIPYYVMSAKGTGLLCLIGNSLGTINRNILEPMRKYFPACIGEVRLADSSVIMFGRKVFLIGADRSDRVAMIQGTGIEYAYGDEITTWNEEFFQMLKSRLDRPESRFDGTCNPDNPGHWFKEFIDQTMNSKNEIVRKSMYYQHYTIDDNADNLDPGTIERMKEQYRGTVYYHRYILGEWQRAEGLIYQEFLPEQHAFMLHGYRPYMVAVKMFSQTKDNQDIVSNTSVRLDNNDPVKNTAYRSAKILAASVRRIRFSCDVGHSNATAYLAVGEMKDGRLYVLD
jgi:PBSX family phage terminase large subunit